MKKVSRETFFAKQNVYHWIDTKIHRYGALKGKKRYKSIGKTYKKRKKR